MFKNILHAFRQMDQVRKRYLAFVVGIFIIFTLVLILVFVYQLENINTIQSENTRNQIVEIKKSLLKDTVNNTLGYIDELKSFNEVRFKARINRLKLFIASHTNDYGIGHLMEYIQSGGVNDDLVIIIKDSNGQIIYESPTAIDYRQGDIIGEYFASEEVVYLEYNILIGALDSSVKLMVEDALRNRLYNDMYFEDSYIWVNEIINYGGGEGYAKRLIHPNLKDTEGTLLSTDMEDIAGGKPYQEELEGIRENGELFFSYYFKKLTTDTVEKKLTFAKLYEEYDWVVAMGIYNDKIEDYITDAREAVDKERGTILWVIALLGTAMTLVGAIVFLSAENRYFANSTQKLITEVETDLLTGAGSRRAALQTISKAFEDFRSDGGIYNLFVMDLDDFKNVNDTYGHEAGDNVLIRVVDNIRNVIREYDHLFRWGGEEFILFTKDIAPGKLDQFMDKVLKAVENSTCRNDDMKLKITVSIGATSFLDSDASYNDAIRRADEGLYQSKRSGKNRGTKVF